MGGGHGGLPRRHDHAGGRGQVGHRARRGGRPVPQAARCLGATTPFPGCGASPFVPHDPEAAAGEGGAPGPVLEPPEGGGRGGLGRRPGRAQPGAAGAGAGGGGGGLRPAGAQLHGHRPLPARAGGAAGRVRRCPRRGGRRPAAAARAAPGADAPRGGLARLAVPGRPRGGARRWRAPPGWRPGRARAAGSPWWGPRCRTCARS